MAYLIHAPVIKRWLSDVTVFCNTVREEDIYTPQHWTGLPGTIQEKPPIRKHTIYQHLIGLHDISYHCSWLPGSETMPVSFTHQILIFGVAGTTIIILLMILFSIIDHREGCLRAIRAFRALSHRLRSLVARDPIEFEQDGKRFLENLEDA